MARKKASAGSGSRKRTSEESPPLSNEPKKRRLVCEKKDDYEQELSKKDKYCWICHSKKLTDDMWYFWPCCPRIYHFNCMSDYPTAESETTCPECQLESVDGTELSKPVPSIKLNELLLSVIQKYLDDDRKGKKSTDKKTEKKIKILPVFYQWPPHAETDLVKVVDFTYLINKIRNDTYSKASEFFSDVKWILHNCHLLYGAQSTVTKDAGKLVQLIKADLLDIEACYECCYHGSQNPDFFIKLCKPPHQIIWAQISGWSHWAAKCLKVNNETVYVKFFGTHQIGKLSVSKCYYISRNHPNYPKSGPKTKSYNDSMAELKKYIKLYELQREPFKYYLHKIAFLPENAGKENQEINLNLMGSPQEDSPVISDDLRLGADFSNLNHPASELSDDQMSSIDRPDFADATHATSSSTSSSLPYFNELEPSVFNQYNSRAHPQVEEIPSSGETAETGSNHPVARENTRQNEINAVHRFFSTGNHQVTLTPQMILDVIALSKKMLRHFSSIKCNHPTRQEVLLAQQNEELQKQILKQRSQFDEDKKQHGDKIREECESEIMAERDKTQNAQMLVRNINIDFSEKLKIKEKEYVNSLCEKELLLEKCQEKLRMKEAECIELKKELENIEQRKELERESIDEAKRNLFCYVCVKSADRVCCINAAYCSKPCQDGDKERHTKTCLKNNPLVSQEGYHKTIEVVTYQEVKKVQTSTSNDDQMLAKSPRIFPGQKDEEEDRLKLPKNQVPLKKRISRRRY